MRAAPTAQPLPMVFDACRNELKLPDKTATKGFLPVQTLRGMFVAFASEFGRTASDLGDKSGPYAAALASELMKPGLSHLDLFQNVKEAVARETGGRQSPWELNGLSQRVRLGPAVASPPPAPQPPSGISGAAEVVRVCREVEAMMSLSMLAVLERQHAGTPAADCISARIGELKAAVAKARVEELTKQKSPSSVATTPTRGEVASPCATLKESGTCMPRADCTWEASKDLSGKVSGSCRTWR